MSYTLSPTMDSTPPSASGQSSPPSVAPQQENGNTAQSPAGGVFGNKEFNNIEKGKIRDLLQKKLGKDHVATRQGAGGAQFTYVESWQTIQIANSIFGFNGWSSSVVDLSPDFIEEKGGKYVVGVTALVKVTLKDGTSHEDVGYGLCENQRKGIAIENAKKEAVTDARKRALRLFGNALGNCIYDKGHVKRIKTTATAGAKDFLPVDTTIDLMNKASGLPSGEGDFVPQQVQQEGYHPNKMQKTTNGPITIKKDVPPKVVAITKPNMNAALPLQRQQPINNVPPTNYQPLQSVPPTTEKWTPNEGDMEALLLMTETC